MNILRRIFPRKIPAADIAALVQGLTIAQSPPPKNIRRIYTSRFPASACDWMGWSIWQEKGNLAVWIRSSGGFAGASLWYGPAEPSLLEKLESKTDETIE